MTSTLTSPPVKTGEAVETNYKGGMNLTMKNSQEGAEADALKDRKNLAIGPVSKINSHKDDSDER